MEDTTRCRISSYRRSATQPHRRSKGWADSPLEVCVARESQDNDGGVKPGEPLAAGRRNHRSRSVDHQLDSLTATWMKSWKPTQIRPSPSASTLVSFIVVRYTHDPLWEATLVQELSVQLGSMGLHGYREIHMHVHI